MSGIHGRTRANGSGVENLGILNMPQEIEIPQKLLDTLAGYQEFENADAVFLCNELGIIPWPETKEKIVSFRRQIWNVAVQEGWRAAGGRMTLNLNED